MAQIIPLKKNERSEPSKFRFTTQRIEKLKSPVKGCKYYYDTEINGLCVRVTATGAKSYVLYRKINGTPGRITLGSTASIKLDAARKAAEQLNGKLAAGVDIVKERREDRKKEVTLKELYEAWLRSAKTRQLRSWREDENLWKLHIKPNMANKEAASITTLHVQRIVDKIAEKHPRTSNKVLALLSRIYNHGIKKGLFININPVGAVDRVPEQSRERFLKPDELPIFIASVEQEDEPWKGYFKILLFTGARKTAAASMRWQDIDFKGSVWHVPSWDSKNKKSLAVPLVPEAAAVLNKIKETAVNDWVFPSSTSTSGHIETPTKPWKRICERAGFTDLRIHDIRRTVGSWLAASGASNFTISKALGHMSPRSADVYARLTVDPVREALGSITKGWKSE